MIEFGEKLENVEYKLRPGSYGVIINDNKIGVIKSRRLNKYFLVGGGTKAGESETQALRREAIEEIGFNIEIGEKTGMATEYFFAEIDNQYFAKKCNFYRISLINKVKAKTENELTWITVDELKEMYHKSHQWIINEELSLIKTAV